MCQDCVDDGRLSQSTYDAIEAFCERWPDAESGPAHVLLADANVDDESIAFCRRELQLAFDNAPRYAGHTLDELIATRAFIEQLVDMPEEER